MAAKLIYAKNIVEQRYLIIGVNYFRCPYCDREFERGGGKEGFVKSGANNHVAACWEALLYLSGYTLSSYHARGGMTVVPIAKGHPNQIRCNKAILRKRERDGSLPTMVRHLKPETAK